MVGYALVEAGDAAVEGAVVTIPAAFNQLQSEATLAAAAQAGLDRVACCRSRWPPRWRPWPRPASAVASS